MKKSIMLGLVLAASTASFAAQAFCGFGCGNGCYSRCNSCCTVRYVQPRPCCCTVVKRTYWVPRTCCQRVCYRPRCGC